MDRGYTLTTLPSYEGMAVQTQKGPLVLEYLTKLHRTMGLTWNHYPRFVGIRCDLRLPLHGSLSPGMFTNEVISRFVESYKAKIRHNREMAWRRGIPHDSVVRFCWAREFGQQQRPHWHMLMLLNGHAFNSLGYIGSDRDNMCWRFIEAWASALRMSPEMCVGLVNFDQNFRVHTVSDWEDWSGFADLFFVSSYLCKSYSKVFEKGVHNFDCSRV